ncbi:MAG TPA: hypothetical protein VGD21_01195 [Lysobacter sp.]
MIAGSFRNTTAALALVFVALAGCTGRASSVQAATNTAAPAPAASAPEGDAVASGTNPDDLCAEDDIACHELFYQLEETLAMYEGGVANRIGERARACWQSDVEAFRRTLDACGDNACRETALRERLASLHYLQAEQHRARLELPEVAQLIAVLGPEIEAAAPRDDAQTPVAFEARGSLIHASAHPEHMGIAVQAASGEDHVFIHDMDIDNQPDHDEVLGLVGTSPTAQVLVRGYRRIAPDGVANFDTARCRLAYQLP